MYFNIDVIDEGDLQECIYLHIIPVENPTPYVTSFAYFIWNLLTLLIRPQHTLQYPATIVFRYQLCVFMDVCSFHRNIWCSFIMLKMFKNVPRFSQVLWQLLFLFNLTQRHSPYWWCWYRLQPYARFWCFCWSFSAAAVAEKELKSMWQDCPF